MKVDNGIPQFMVRMPELPAQFIEMSLKVERDVLGLLMLWDDVDSVDIDPGWFSTYEHLAIYYAIQAAKAFNSRSDVVTVSEQLDMAGALEGVGGLHYLGKLASESSRLRTWQLTPLLRGFALMRYAMASKSSEKYVARLDDAVMYGWLHGKSWKANKEQLDAKHPDNVCELRDGEDAWVCYVYIDPEGLSEALEIIAKNRDSVSVDNPTENKA
ncbi:DnaB-like helicase N-terminal domain-containing protein [Pseudomonas aeruginosa]|uniref:DnaB-like helicase N-terminal domain-containing protein n=1 Tax=Pseudomonas aeruginosa TaxID=287 RepID=UPI003D02F5A1